MKPITVRHDATLGLAVTLLITLTGCGTTAKTLLFNHPTAKKIFTPPKPDRTVTGKAWTNSIGSGTNMITVLHVSGDNFYSLGYHHGRLLGPQVKATIEEVLEAAQGMLPSVVRRHVSLRVNQ